MRLRWIAECAERQVLQAHRSVFERKTEHEISTMH